MEWSLDYMCGTDSNNCEDPSLNNCEPLTNFCKYNCDEDSEGLTAVDPNLIFNQNNSGADDGLNTPVINFKGFSYYKKDNEPEPPSEVVIKQHGSSEFDRNQLSTINMEELYDPIPDAATSTDYHCNPTQSGLAHGNTTGKGMAHGNTSRNGMAHGNTSRNGMAHGNTTNVEMAPTSLHLNMKPTTYTQMASENIFPVQCGYHTSVSEDLEMQNPTSKTTNFQCCNIGEIMDNDVPVVKLEGDVYIIDDNNSQYDDHLSTQYENENQFINSDVKMEMTMSNAPENTRASNSFITTISEVSQESSNQYPSSTLHKNFHPMETNAFSHEGSTSRSFQGPSLRCMPVKRLNHTTSGFKCASDNSKQVNASSRAKRISLAELSNEQKTVRIKLQNKVASKTYRDRKKFKNEELKVIVQQLEIKVKQRNFDLQKMTKRKDLLRDLIERFV